jgi:hypothetical protein
VTWKTLSLPIKFDGNVFDNISDLFRSPSLWCSSFHVTAEPGTELHICLSDRYLTRQPYESFTQKGVFVLPAAVMTGDFKVSPSDVISLAVSKTFNCELSLDVTIKAGVHGNLLIVVPFHLQSSKLNVNSPESLANEDEFWLTIASNMPVFLQENMDKYQVSRIDDRRFSHAVDDDYDTITYRPANIRTPRAPSDHPLDAWDIVHKCREAASSLNDLSRKYAEKKLPGFVFSVSVVSCNIQNDNLAQAFSLEVSIVVSGVGKRAFELQDPILHKCTGYYLQMALATSLNIDYRRVDIKSVINASQQSFQAVESVLVELEVCQLDGVFCKDAVGMLHNLNFASLMQKMCASDYHEKQHELKSALFFLDPDEVLILSAQKIASETALSKEVLWKRPAEVYEKRGNRVSKFMSENTESEFQLQQKFVLISSNQAGQPYGIVGQNLFGNPCCAAVRGPCGTKTVFEALTLCSPMHSTRRAAFLRNLFVGPPLEECARYGVYSLQLYVRGAWSIITIDDRIPVDSEGSNMFLSCENEESAWAPLIEKGLAKVLGGYISLRKCSPHQLAQVLTGSGHEIFYLDRYNTLVQDSNGDLLVQGTQRTCMEWHKKAILEEDAIRALKFYVAGQLTRCEYIIQRTCSRRHCGSTEAILRNMGMYDIMGVAHSILTKQLVGGRIIGAWKRLQLKQGSNQLTVIQSGHVYRIYASRTIYGVFFYQVLVLNL